MLLNSPTRRERTARCPGGPIIAFVVSGQSQEALSLLLSMLFPGEASSLPLRLASDWRSTEATGEDRAGGVASSAPAVFKSLNYKTLEDRLRKALLLADASVEKGELLPSGERRRLAHSFAGRERFGC